MNNEQAEKLLKLAEYLEREKLDLEFDFRTIYEENGCGSVGCALGCLSYVFPDKWSIRRLHPRVGFKRDMLEVVLDGYERSEANISYTFLRQSSSLG